MAITRKMVEQAYDQGIIKLINNFGIMAKIGDYNFWFGGSTAEEYSSPDTYVIEIGESTVKDMIYETLEDFRKCEDYADEYAYYEEYINEMLAYLNRSKRKSKEIAMKLTGDINTMGIDFKEVAKALATYGHRSLQYDFGLICCYFLKEVAKDDYQYDERNKAIHHIAKNILNPDFEL